MDLMSTKFYHACCEIPLDKDVGGGGKFVRQGLCAMLNGKISNQPENVR